jgi:hypothetical protein
MPIARHLLKLYPGGSIRSNAWRAIRKRILERAGYRCEGTPDRPDCRAENGKPHPETGSIVRLTCAHMDHDVSNNSDDNIRALCERCHNLWDLPVRKVNARRTRRGRRAIGDFFEGEH